MIFTRLNPKGLHPREVTGIRQLETGLAASQFSAGWFGYTNLLVRKRNAVGERREIDLILVTHDRVVMADLKDWGGKITNSAGTWLHKRQRRGPSAVLKIEDNSHSLVELLRTEARAASPRPRVEYFVLFTAADADISGLSANDLTNAMRLGDFLTIMTDRLAYSQRFGSVAGWSEVNPLTAGVAAAALAGLFREGGPFVPREASFAEYEVQGEPTHEHRGTVWKEYAAAHRTNSSSTGLLRIWDCEKLPTMFSAIEARRGLLAREQTVLSYLQEADPEFHSDSTLPWRARDEDFGMRFWEVFELRRTARRLASYVVASPELAYEKRAELVAILLAKSATLHRRRIAHRDLGAHSVWIEPESARIRFSAFGAAHFPDPASVGDTRLALLAAGEPLPEDRGVARPGSAFQQDVFLLGVLCWQVLVGIDVPRSSGVASPEGGAATLLPPQVENWLRKALEREPGSRYADAIEMADTFEAAVGRRAAAGLAQEMERHRSDLVPFMEWPVALRMGAARATAWVSGNGTDAVLVKLWPAPRRDAEPQAQALAFLDTAARLRADRPWWAPEIVGAGWGEHGLYVASRFLDGVAWDDLSTLGPEDMLRAVASLVRAVSDMHVRGMAHGDLKPANVLVAGEGAELRALLVDLPDLPPAGADSLSSPAYAPSGGAAGPRERDIFALGKMAQEALAALGADPDDGRLAGRLLRALASAGRAFPMLDTLAAELDKPDRTPAPPSLELAFGVRDTRGQDEILPDNGKFHVVVSTGGRSLFIVGLDQQLRVELDLDGQASACSVRDAPPQTLSWAIGARTISFPGRVRLFEGSTETAGVTALLGKPEILAALAAARASPPAGLSEEPGSMSAGHALPSPPQPGIGAPTRPVPAASDRWRAILAAEEDAVPSVSVISDARWDPLTSRHYVDCESVPEQLDVGPAEAVKVSRNGRHVAELDVGRSRGPRLALARFKGHPIRAGDRLELQSEEGRSSLKKRQQAVSRAVARAAVMPDLLDHFDEGSSARPVKYAKRGPTDAELAPYGLNSDQVDAFKHLWATGPVGLLQGPPGTGKSRFVGAFVHWAARHGGMERILLLSQSHGATNTVAESVLRAAVACGDHIPMLRVGQADRVTEPLLPFHPASVQEGFSTSFEARGRSRAEVVGRNLGLPPAYVAELYELEAALAPVVGAIGRRRREMSSSGDPEDLSLAKARLSTLHSAFGELLARFAPGRHLDPASALPLLRAEMAARHSVSDRDAQSRMLHSIDLARNWLEALSGRHQGVEEFLARTRPVVCGTCVGIGRPAVNVAETEFDLVVIDEAARCDPGELAVGLQSGRRALLVGDHKQLPPLYDRIVARNAARALRMQDLPGRRAIEELSVSDFARSFVSPYGVLVGRSLRKQYRMAAEIRAMVSDCFYPEVGLSDGRGPPGKHYDALPAPLDRQVTWLDTSSEPGGAEDKAEGTSYSNGTEVRIVMGLLRHLAARPGLWHEMRARKELAPGEQAVGVIAMYSAQRNALQAAFDALEWPEGFPPLVRIDTVDAYQAKENRIVIVSLVRSAPRGPARRKKRQNPLPHATDYRRVNVALSRAMDRLVVVGAADLFRADWNGNSLRRVVGHLEEQERLVPCGTVDSSSV